MKLNYKKTIKVGLAFAIVMVFWTAYDYTVPLLLDNTFGLSNSMRGLIMGLDNLLSVFLLPLFGKLSDKSTHKYGRRTPFIVIGTCIAALLTVFVPVTALKQLRAADALKIEITTTNDWDGLYTHIYNLGATDTDYADYSYFKANGINTVEDYLAIAQNRVTTDDKGKEVLTDEYKQFVDSGIKAYASHEIYESLTKNNPGTLVFYMVVLLFVLIAMATFRSPAVALMPDVTPKPLRTQANAMINLVGGAGGALAAGIYMLVFLLDKTPNAYVIIFSLMAASMLGLLAAFLALVK